MRLIRKCLRDGRYTLKENCPVCGGETRVAHPPRFSPQDRMVRYRVIAKRGREC
ncbi:RNA-protein complex protein Nop10 [Metallosphaera tengchongensis]|uniref:Ribosome biogenesis protein Nop10 n=1 Tax=Metallosphaera tengchongensis TaxID=1532350 RepID=A0A6N0NWB0_9CREN|nr:RNA-protein complex protein Nop10 [Metallosphaera tengchongensis]QKQ99439.1 RNA-protein complex protein Nop10 [Metallosphaera tengchongensis]